jgi:hypothetical protein
MSPLSEHNVSLRQVRRSYASLANAARHIRATARPGSSLSGN